MVKKIIANRPKRLIQSKRLINELLNMPESDWISQNYGRPMFFGIPSSIRLGGDKKKFSYLTLVLFENNNFGSGHNSCVITPVSNLEYKKYLWAKIRSY